MEPAAISVIIGPTNSNLPHLSLKIYHISGKVTIFSGLLTIHLALVGEYDLPPATGGVDGQRLMEALLNLGGPHSLGITYYS